MKRENKPRNFVQKHMGTFNRPQVHKNKKWENENNRQNKFKGLE